MSMEFALQFWRIDLFAFKGPSLTAIGASWIFMTNLPVRPTASRQSEIIDNIDLFTRSILVETTV